MKKPKQTFWLTQHTSHSSGGMRRSSMWWKSSLLISNTARTGRWCFCKSNVIVNTFQVLTLMRRALNRANPRATGNKLLCSERGELHSLGVTYLEVDLVSDTGGKYISMRDSENMTTAQMLSWSFQVVLESSCWCSSFPPPLRMPLTGWEGEMEQSSEHTVCLHVYMLQTSFLKRFYWSGVDLQCCVSIRHSAK